MKIIIKLIRLYLSAWLGNANAQNDIGCMYSTGNEVSQDHTKALNWFRRAAELGDAESQFHLGGMYKYGTGGLPQNRVEAEKWYRKAAEQGHANSQFELGRMYDLEGGLPKTTTKL